MDNSTKSLQDLDSDDITVIRQHMQRRMHWLGFGGSLEQRYRQQRSDDFQRTVSEGAPWLVLFHVLMNIITWVVRHPSGEDFQMWMTTLIITTAAIAVGLLVAMVPVLRRNFNILGALCGGLVIFVEMTAAQLYQNLDLAQDVTYVALLAMIVTSLGIRLLFPAAAVALITSSAAALVTGIVIEARIDWLSVTIYVGAGIVICLYLAHTLERMERRAFLQSLLLSWEGQQLDVANRKLDQLSRRDPLTNLANRRDFDEILIEEWERARREEQPVSLLYMDIDHFKLYNDHYGHSAGDTCLIKISKVLAEALKRPGDMAARYGGEEFVLLLPNTDERGARRVAERLIKRVDSQRIVHLHSRTAGHVTISIGVATRIPSRDHGTSQTLLDIADAALYAAKNAGRHRLHVASDNTPTTAITPVS